ncbi:MAG: hypothetical protein NW226_08145 [Microscillaceae bacterium]|nr:hypothetical protein [Microscillaceae bacterium]
MNTKKRFVVMFLFIFILGFLIGVLLTAALVRRQLRLDKFYRTEAGFPQAISKMIQVKNTQKTTIDSILRQKAKQFQVIQRENKKKVVIFLDTLQSDVEPFLEIAQKEKLRKRLKEIQKKLEAKD